MGTDIKKITISPDILAMPIVEERLDTQTSHGYRWITWLDSYNKTWELKEMTDGHVNHLYNWLKRNHYHKASAVVACEVSRRANDGQYPAEFDEVMDIFKQSPDISRLLVHENAG